ncbi:MAG: sodium:solute symporter [Bacteroidota bacterium]
MQLLDWIILATTLLFIVGYGTWVTRKNRNVQDYIRGGNTAKWYTIGLSVMATQASAITFLSTTGQAFFDGMGFVQFYFGLPIAMVVICLVFIPLYHRLKVFTAYEFLEQRFDLKTRTLTAILFLIQRGLAAGITIFAPAIILSIVLGWNLITLNIVIGILVIIYTVSGGTKAVSVTQKQQMFVIFAGMFTVLFITIDLIPDEINFTNALDIAGACGKMDILDFSFNLENRYTFWSGIIGGGFLALSYFGTDQSQVQRYLSGKSIKEMRWGMIFNGLLKVPMQFFILLVGVMVFVFYQFNPSPLNFNPEAEKAVLNSTYAEEYRTLQESLKGLQDKKADLSLSMVQVDDNGAKPDVAHLDELKKALAGITAEEKVLRTSAKELIAKADEGVETNDRDYMFITFILNNLPKGLIGLLLAVILSAAMSSTASEINALATITSIDLYKRNRPEEKEETHYVKITKLFTLMWGLLAILVASFANLAENLIQLVNIIGSIFYGNVLGIFLLAFFVKYVRGNAVFLAAFITQIVVIIGWWLDWMPYLWLNLFGCALVMLMAVLMERIHRTRYVVN